MPDLSPEDQFRLEILLTRQLLAVRINESAMILHALAVDGEAQLPLHPNDRPERYLRRIREILAGHALGSPGGYPVHLTRWTRHGQLAGENLAQLLLTAEPEAVVAVVHSPALTDAIAERAWWAMPTMDNARLMLQREQVAQGTMGPVLAAFMVEHLPFLQDDHLGIMDTAATLLYTGILSPEQELAIWRRGKRSNTFYVPFLELRPTRLPDTVDSEDDRGFIRTALEVLEKPETQEVVTRTLNAVGQHFTQRALTLANAGRPDASLDVLANCSEHLIADIFARSTAIGSLMRRKIEPALGPVRLALQTRLAG